MNKLNVAVIFGGRSTEHEVSRSSAVTVISNMSEELYQIIPVYITKEGKWLMYDGGVDNIRNVQWEKYGTPVVFGTDATRAGLIRTAGEKVRYLPVDAVFPVLHGLNGEDGTIQGLLELAGVPYVGCGVLSSAICMDKAFMRVMADSLGVRQTAYLAYKRHEVPSSSELQRRVRSKLGYPCFVKPANSGSTIGVTKVKDKTELADAIDAALMYDNKILIEKMVVGRELECAVLGTGGDDTEASVVGEILSAGEFYDYESKYASKDSKTVAPADIPDYVSDEIKNLSIRIFKQMDCRGLARVDFFWDEAADKVIYNEINTMPGFTSISMYPTLWEAAGVPTPELVDRLIRIAVE